MNSIGPRPSEKAGRHYFYHERSLKPGLTFSLLPNPGTPWSSVCGSRKRVFQQEKRKPRKESPWPGGRETLRRHTNQATRNRGTGGQANATCPVPQAGSGQRVLRSRGETHATHRARCRERERGCGRCPRAPRPPLGAPGAARSEHTRRRKPEGLEGRGGGHGVPRGHQASRGARGARTRPGRRARAGWACKGLGEGVQASPAGPAGRRPGAAGGVGARRGAGYRVVHPPHQDAEDRLAGPE